MIDFTLYIFAKVFDLAYSTGPSERHLLKLFYDYYSPEAFNRVVIGKTAGAVWINRINVKQETCKSLSGERIKYVYRRIFNKPVYESEEKTLVEELLRHSVGFAQGIQAAVYQKRDTDEVKNFIESLKNMEETDYRSDDIFLAQNPKNNIINNYNNNDNCNKLFDPDKTLDSLLEEAKKGNESAMISAGIYYYYGISGGKNERNAAEWFKKVSILNQTYAPISNKFIARMYYAGSMPREEQSYEKSYEYHVKSAIGDRYSASQVGFMQSIGSGCPYDYKKTEEYFLKILNTLDNPRKDTVCRFYISHGEFKKAADIYVGMADTFPEAAYQLGLLYKSGVLSEPFMPDYSKAETYLRKALDKGYNSAAYELGTLYLNPTGNFKKDFQKANTYYHIAADNGNPEAQYMLGYMYYYGHVEKNINKSLKYHEMAAAQGNVLSSAHLALLYQLPEILDYDKAFKYAKYASDCGDSTSEFVLGTLYLSGRGCVPDEDKAYLCFKHSAETGTQEALLFLMKMDNNESC